MAAVSVWYIPRHFTFAIYFISHYGASAAPRLFSTSSSHRATTDPFTFDDRDESNFFAERQLCDYVYAPSIHVTASRCIALEHDLSRKKKKPPCSVT